MITLISLPENPLRGENDAFFGPRFSDMSEPYSMTGTLNDKLHFNCSRKEDIALRKGVYACGAGT